MKLERVLCEYFGGTSEAHSDMLSRTHTSLTGSRNGGYPDGCKLAQTKG